MNETFIVHLKEPEQDDEADFLDGVEPQECNIDDQECEACQ